MEWNSPSADQDLCNDILTNEVMAIIKTLKAGKAPGPDNFHPEFFLHLDEKCFEWLRILFSHCLSTKKLPSVWKMVKVIHQTNQLITLAVIDPLASYAYSENYVLLCIPYKLYKRLVYDRIKSVIESGLPEEKAGFRLNRCTLDQVALLTEDIEASFDKKLKASAVFVDLSTAYDTVWHRGLILKLLRIIQSKEMVRYHGYDIAKPFPCSHWKGYITLSNPTQWCSLKLCNCSTSL